jgi:hypothetical protein
MATGWKSKFQFQAEKCFLSSTHCLEFLGSTRMLQTGNRSSLP